MPKGDKDKTIYRQSPALRRESNMLFPQKRPTRLGFPGRVGQVEDAACRLLPAAFPAQEPFYPQIIAGQG